MTASVAARPTATAGSPSDSSARAAAVSSPDPELAGPADSGVGHERQDRRIQPDLRGQPGQEGVAHRLGDEHGPDGEAGDEIAVQIAPGVAREPFEDRQPTPAGGRGRIAHVALPVEPIMRAPRSAITSSLTHMRKQRDGEGR